MFYIAEITFLTQLPD